MIELFDKKFVHFMWDEELNGKEVFYSDSIDTLADSVNVQARRFAVSEGSTDYPFLINSSLYKFAYYDPNYEVKLAYNKGKTIQFKSAIDKTWCDYGNMEGLWQDKYEYRIKPEEPKRMTYRRLSEWLVRGNGEVTCRGDVSTTLDYNEAQSYEEVDDCYSIRRWGSDEWIEPTYEVYKEDVLTSECRENEEKEDD